MEDFENATCLWKPSYPKETNIDKFTRIINEKFALKIENYHQLHQWSIQHYPHFWEEVFQFTGIKISKSYDQIIDKSKRMDEIPQWFEGCLLNYAENMLKHSCSEKVAIYAAVEGSDVITQKLFAELRISVAELSSAMKKMGIKKGDRVVGYIPNCIEAVEAMLAAASIGAIWSSTSPDFGVSGVLDRFSQIQPKLIFSVNAVIYNGKVHDHLEKLKLVVQGLPDLERVVLLDRVNQEIDLSSIEHGETFADFIEGGKNLDGSVPSLVFEQLPFNHPLYIMYSSGTTGAPKCMVHSAGGTLLKHLEEHILQGNMQPEDIMFYYTTTGWMMWNWFVSAMATGAAIVCYDGSPLVPTPNVLWDLVDKLKVTILGTGAKWISVLEEKSVRPMETHDLASLHTILSTGSPLKPQSYDFVYSSIKKDVLLGSITGGTDIIACFAGQNSNLPVHRGEIQSANLGMSIESWDESGKKVVGESGELICNIPFPSMPTKFWNDSNGQRYHQAYFDHFDGIWAHGDFCMFNPVTRGLWMLGRSDGTLNPNGVRFGSSEIYNIVESFKEIQDSLCIGQRSKNGIEERVVLFLKMAPVCDFNADLVKKLRVDIRSQLSARHVPAIILPIADIPYTISGKKIEVAVKKVISGQSVANRGAFSNPESLEYYQDIPALQDF